MCCLTIYRIVTTINRRPPTVLVMQDQQGEALGHVNLAMDLDDDDLQQVDPQITTSFGLLNTLRSTLTSNVLGTGLEEVLVHHDELSKTYKGDLITEQQILKTNALGSSLGSRNLTKALRNIFEINNESDNPQMLGSTWPQPKKLNQ